MPLRDTTQKLIDLETRKSVHINLTRAVHSEFRRALLDHSLSMQEVFATFASLVGENDQAATSIIKEAYRRRSPEGIVDCILERSNQILLSKVEIINNKI